jgi:hypothetical protein
MSKQEIVDYLMKPLGSFVGCSSYLQYPNLSHLVPESKPEKKGVNFIERLCFAKDVSGLWTNRAGSMQLISAFRAASFSNHVRGPAAFVAQPVAREQEAVFYEMATMLSYRI